MSDAYEDFLRAKIKLGERAGFDVDDAELNPALKDHTRAIVRWALAGGRRGIFASFGLHKIEQVYDFERDLAIAEHVDEHGWLPSTFMLLPPQSWHPDVWTDVTRMRTLNAEQWSHGKEMHLCPLQFDIVDRLVTQFSMPDEWVYDPFAGLGTVPMRSIKLRRRGRGAELNSSYWRDSIAYCRAAEHEIATPSLFDLLDSEAEEAA